jgi:group II intron reverse transcriptase/maturase
MMNLPTPATVGKLQTALHDKAKAKPDLAFYTLYDKLYRPDVLLYAYQRSEANGGVAGVDGQTFLDVEAYGVEKWLGELAKALKDKTYRPDPLLRAYIPKADGGHRPLGIPTVRDRVVQTATALVIGPIFEADLEPEQYAYRPEREALGAVVQVQRLLDAGYTDVVDADLSGYFDSIPHADLMKSVARRIRDGAVLHLLKMWLEAPVVETNAKGCEQRTTPAKDAGRGTPQGGAISPLLANVYMRRFVHGWKYVGHAYRLQAYVINYADDFVILSQGHAAEALAAMQRMMSHLKLTVNERKTGTCRLPEGSFTFLGYTFGKRVSWRTGRAYLCPRPAVKRVQRLCRALSLQTDRRTCGGEVAMLVRKLNSMLRGWANYFCVGPVQEAYETVMQHVRRRLRQWLCHKYDVRTREYGRFPNAYLHDQLGLIQLSTPGHRLLWAKS